MESEAEDTVACSEMNSFSLLRMSQAPKLRCHILSGLLHVSLFSCSLTGCFVMVAARVRWPRWFILFFLGSPNSSLSVYITQANIFHNRRLNGNSNITISMPDKALSWMWIYTVSGYVRLHTKQSVRSFSYLTAKCRSSWCYLLCTPFAWCLRRGMAFSHHFYDRSLIFFRVDDSSRWKINNELSCPWNRHAAMNGV